MAKRGGLGQRGLNLLISTSPGSSDNSGQETEKTVSSGRKTSGSGKKEKTAASKKTTGKASNETSKTSKSRAKITKTKASQKEQEKKERKTGIDNNLTSEISEDLTEKNLQEFGSEADLEKTEPKEASVTSQQANDSVETASALEEDNNGTGGIGTFNTENSSTAQDPLLVPIVEIEPNRSQPRKNFDEDSLQELADSIRQYGVIQPLIVQKKNDYYEIIAGERRWRAARIAGVRQVPVVVKDYTPREVMEISLIENIQRQDLNPIEEAAAYRNLMEEYHLHQDEVAQRVSRSRAAIANAVRLLNLDKRVQDMVVSEMLSTGHARALLAVTDPELQYTTAQKIFDEKLSVREVERLVRKMNQNTPAPAKKAVSDALLAVYTDMAEQMKTSLGTKVRISAKSPQKGRIEIEYYSADELDRLCSVLNSIRNTEEG